MLGKFVFKSILDLYTKKDEFIHPLRAVCARLVFNVLLYDLATLISLKEFYFVASLLMISWIKAEILVFSTPSLRYSKLLSASSAPTCCFGNLNAVVCCFGNLSAVVYLELVILTHFFTRKSAPQERNFYGRYERSGLVFNILLSNTIMCKTAPLREDTFTGEK